MKYKHLILILEIIAIVLLAILTIMKLNKPIPHGTNLLSPTVANQVIIGDFK